MDKLTYYGINKLQRKKSFITLAPGDNVMKPLLLRSRP